MQRILTYSGQFTSPTFFVQHSPAEYESIILQSLQQGGWGIQGVRVTVNYSAVPTAYGYSFTIGVYTPANENPERVKQGLYSALINNGLTVNAINLIGDNTGQAQVVDDSVIGSISQSLFGANNPKATATILGLSTGTALAIGIGALVFIALRSPTSPISYIRR